MSCCFSQSIVDCLQEHHHNLGFAAIFPKYHNHGDVILSGSQIAKGIILKVLYAIDFSWLNCYEKQFPHYKYYINEIFVIAL